MTTSTVNSLVTEPWHGLGVKLDAPDTIDKAIKDSGLDWKVATYPMFYEGAGGVLEKVRKSNIVVREDNKGELGVVGKKFTPLQNEDAFAFFQPFLDAGEVTIDYAGAYKGGRHVWILAKLAKQDLEVVDGDPVAQYLLLANGHDGTLSVTVALSPIRIVCLNSLAAITTHEHSKILRANHYRNIKDTVKEIRDIVDVTNRAFVASVDQYKSLSKKGISEAELKAFVQKVFVPKKKQEELNKELEKLGLRTYKKIVPLFEEGTGNDIPGVRGTWWAAYNAVTEYLTHHRGNSADTRMDSLWFGNNAITNKKALHTALEMA